MKMIIKNKKGAEGIVWTVAIIALLLFFLLIYSGVWTKLFGKEASSLSTQIDKDLGPSGDYDKDGVINIVDKCPCQAGDANNDGCPYTNKNEDRSCLTKKT